MTVSCASSIPDGKTQHSLSRSDVTNASISDGPYLALNYLCGNFSPSNLFHLCQPMEVIRRAWPFANALCQRLMCDRAQHCDTNRHTPNTEVLCEIPYSSGAMKMKWPESGVHALLHMRMRTCTCGVHNDKSMNGFQQTVLAASSISDVVRSFDTFVPLWIGLIVERSIYLKQWAFPSAASSSSNFLHNSCSINSSVTKLLHL